MIEIIPSINCPTFEEVQERVKKVEPYVSWCHLDVTDGVFSKHITWHNPSDLPMLNTPLSAEVHVMINQPEMAIEQWCIRPIKRIIVHWEAVRDIEFIIKKCHDTGIEIGLAINPETFWGCLKPWFKKVDLVQVLAVHPGPSGQKIEEDIFDKVIHMRAACRSCTIEVDGGINVETGRRAVMNGANILVAGSFIFNSPNSEEAINKLKSLSP